MADRPARTIVFQSYRTRAVPAWIERCMASVRDWAEQSGFDYRFHDDALLERAPAWLRQRAGGELCPVTDVARLAVAAEHLDEGYERAVWIDADVLVFDPDRMSVDAVGGFGFCHEIWLTDTDGRIGAEHRVNNAVCAFDRGSPHLAFLHDMLLRRAREVPALGKLDLGTQPLTALRSVFPFHLFEHVGVLGPRLLAEIDLGGQRLLRAYGQALAAPLAAANLCASLVDSGRAGPMLDHERCERVVDRLLSTRGELLNRHVVAAPGVPSSILHAPVAAT